MSWPAVRWALHDADVANSADRLVLIALADHANPKAWPSQSTLAKITKLSERRVRSSLRSLESAGLITAEHRPGASTVYELPLTPAKYVANPGTLCRLTLMNPN